jgi:hypothetical protein
MHQWEKKKVDVDLIIKLCNKTLIQKKKTRIKTQNCI